MSGSNYRFLSGECAGQGVDNYRFELPVRTTEWNLPDPFALNPEPFTLTPASSHTLSQERVTGGSLR